METLRYQLITLMLVLSISSFAQVKLGVKFSPGITTSKASTTSDTLTISDNASGLRFIGGLTVDYQFSDNYYFTSGLAFANRKSGYKSTGLSGTVFNDNYNSQYVQIPFALKMYTNEVAVDKKVYFQAGVAFDIKVKDNAAEKANALISKMSLFDASIQISSGLEMALGSNTSAFGGISFQKGLLNMASEYTPSNLTLKNTFIGLEVGVKF